MNTGHLILLVIAAVILAYCMMRKKEYYGTQSYKYVDSGNAMYCEHNQDCEWDTARTVTLRDGSEGVCTLNGLACRSFY